MGRKGNLAVFESTNISETKEDHAHQNWCACMWHQPLLTWFFWADSDRLNFLMTMDYSPWVRKGNLAVFESTNISETKEDHAHQNWCACTWHPSLLAWIFWADSDRLNFLMTMDYSPWSERELAWIFWADSDRLNFLMTMDYSPWVGKGNLICFWRYQYLRNQRGPRLPKLVCMHVTSTPAYMIFLGRFRSIKFFDDHGL